MEDVWSYEKVGHYLGHCFPYSVPQLCLPEECLYPCPSLHMLSYQHWSFFANELSSDCWWYLVFHNRDHTWHNGGLSSLCYKSDDTNWIYSAHFLFPYRCLGLPVHFYWIMGQETKTYETRWVWKRKANFGQKSFNSSGHRKRSRSAKERNKLWSSYKRRILQQVAKKAGTRIVAKSVWSKLHASRIVVPNPRLNCCLQWKSWALQVHN